MLKKLLARVLPVNLLKEKLGFPTQKRSLERLRTLGFRPRLILDLGAYEGSWALFVNRIFPEARIMMIEGQADKSEALKKVSAHLPGTDYRIALLGAEEKEVEFNVYDTASSVLTEENVTGAIVEKRTLQLLDKVLTGTPFASPDLIKIDCQGYELEILKGGKIAWSAAAAILLEVSLLNVYTDCPLVAEVIALMKQNGFVLYDICSLMKRPYDQALFQSDFLFIREDSPFRQSTRWS